MIAKETLFYLIMLLLIISIFSITIFARSESFSCISNTPKYLAEHLSKDKSVNTFCKCDLFNNKGESGSIRFDKRGIITVE